MKKGILFDLDGTLWDSSDAVAKAWSEQLEKEGYGPDLFNQQDMMSVMGYSMDLVAQKLLGFIEDEDLRNAIVRRCEQYENVYLEKHPGTTYEGLKELLEPLRKKGYMLGVVSNCQKGYIEAFYEGTGLKDSFDDQECYGSTLQKKSANIQAVAKRNDLDLCIYVGDTSMDQQEAADANVPFVHAAYGFGTSTSPWVIQNLHELPTVIEQIEQEKLG